MIEISGGWFGTVNSAAIFLKRIADEQQIPATMEFNGIPLTVYPGQSLTEAIIDWSNKR